MGIIYNAAIRLLLFTLIILTIIMLPGILPRPIFPFLKFTVTPAKDLKGVLKINNHLDGAERLLEGFIHGPEHLLARKNEIYTGIHGEVIKLTADDITQIATFDQPCGLAFDTIGNSFIVADIYNGLWEVDFSNGKKKLLVSAQQELDGKIKRKPKAFNSVAVDKKGDIYWTDSSSDGLLLSIFANPSGRLFHYDRLKNESKCLMDELFYANGVIIDPNEDFLIIAETGASRLLKYHLKGPKRGQHEIFVDGLPGTPDNLTPDSDGIWVPLFMAKDADHPSAFAALSQFPTIRLLLSRLLAFFDLLFRVFSNVFPNRLGPKCTYFIGQIVMPAMPKRSTIIRIDWSGNILGSLHGFDRSVGLVSHVLELNDNLLLGSPYNRFIGKVKLPKSTQEMIHNVITTPSSTTIPTITTETTTSESITTITPKLTTPNPALKPTEVPTQGLTATTTPSTPPKDKLTIVDSVSKDSLPQEKLKTTKTNGDHSEL